MNKPIKQHYIPRSYLKNFSEKRKKEYFINACQKEKNSKIINPNIKNVCAKGNLYTIPINDESKKYAIEYFYGEKVDSVYPGVYKILTDEKVKFIDFNTRLKIVNTALSLYFRTPKFLNEQNRLIEKMIRDLANMTEGNTVSYEFLGETISFQKDEIESIVKEKKERNRILFLSEHLRAYEKLVQLKLMDGICVYKLNDESEFITSDNPLIMRPFMDPTDLNFDYSILNEDINPFNVKNMIHLSLDNKHILTIMPRMEEAIVNTIQRLEVRKIDGLMYNSDIEKYADEWILGTKEGIEEHYKDQKIYNEKTPENLGMFEDYKEMVLELSILTELMERHGIRHEKVLSRIEEMKSNPKVMADPNFMKIVNEIEKTTDNKG
jgi:uncharacterized protein DUF4238